MRSWRTLALIGLAIGILAGGAPAVRAIDDATARPLVISTVALPDGAAGLHAEIAKRPGLFLLDSGAGVTLVTPETAALSGCRPWGNVSGFRATGERMDSPRCDNLRVVIGGRTFTAPTASVFDVQPLMGADMPTLSGVIGLDLFAGKAITIRPLAHELVVETESSLRERIQGAKEVPVRLVRDAEGVALSVDAAVGTPAGRAWLEIDTGNEGPIMVDKHVAVPLGLAAPSRDRQEAAFNLIGGVAVRGSARVSDLIMDGDIGESVLGHWDVTFDLANGRAWFRPAFANATALK